MFVPDEKYQPTWNTILDVNPAGFEIATHRRATGKATGRPFN
jgi:hypothetical protein